jgi:hypothetical protein
LIIAPGLSSRPVRIELSEQAHVIVHSLQGWIVKLKRDAVAFFYETLVERVCFPKAAFPILLIVTMFTVAMIADKDLFDMGWRIFDITPMLINIAEEEAQDNALLPHVDSGKDFFTFDS